MSFLCACEQPMWRTYLFEEDGDNTGLAFN